MGSGKGEEAKSGYVIDGDIGNKNNFLAKIILPLENPLAFPMLEIVKWKS